MDANFKKQFGRRIKELRKLSDLSQEKLAEIAGLSTKTISYIENGKNTVSFNKIPILANALNVPVYKLFISYDFENDTKALDKLLKTASSKEIKVIEKIVQNVLSLKN